MTGADGDGPGSLALNSSPPRPFLALARARRKSVEPSVGELLSRGEGQSDRRIYFGRQFYPRQCNFTCSQVYLETKLQSPPSARQPTFGHTFALNPMFTFFAVQTGLHFVTAASYEIYLPPNLGLLADGGLCS